MSDFSSTTSRPKWLVPFAAISGLLLVILFALGILGGGEKTKPGTTASKGLSLPAGAKTYQLSLQATLPALSWQGTVRSRTDVKITPKLNARILEVNVHPGEPIKKGAIIARLDNRELLAAYNAAQAAQAAAQAQAKLAKSEENRMIDLYAKQAATRQNYDTVMAQSQAAQALANQASASAQQAKVMLGENVLYAPFDGVIAERLQEPGDMGMPNQPIVSLLKPDDLRLEAAVADHCLPALKLGMPIQVRIDALQQTLTGKLDEISPEVDPETRSLTLKVSLPKHAGLQHGQFGWLELACQAEKAILLIPTTAIVHYGQLETVWVLENGTLHSRHIRTGKQYAEQREVLSGLRVGESILVNAGKLP